MLVAGEMVNLLTEKALYLFFYYSIGCLGENANHHKYCNCNKFSQNWNACDFKMCDCKLIFLSWVAAVLFKQNVIIAMNKVTSVALKQCHIFVTYF